jgi:hypothetical protein
LTGSNQPYLPTAPGAHRLLGDDPEDVLASGLDGVTGGLAGHHQHPVIVGRPPHPHLLDGHGPMLPSKNVQ